MSKLQLTDICKTYRSGDIVEALKGVSVEFRESEFVAVLGPSGCGKTTFLNIIGGLDHYDSGDLALGGMSTKHFKSADWDAYRNCSIGFVFQNYNLIGHQRVLQNVELALTLSGVSASERRRRATEALEAVGLADQLKKKPNQLSGGQMQRVAIARALVNNPDIILADEPTGSLDSHTSIQVMGILKEIAKTKLVIMVTHNGDLAEEYATRIIRLLDGELISDSNPLFNDEGVGRLAVDAVPAPAAGPTTKRAARKAAKRGSAENPAGLAAPTAPTGPRLIKTSMSMITATGLSLKNLLTKKGRTFTTAFAGSIGIIGVALVLALSTGLSAYMSKMQSDTLSGYPITVTETPMDVQSFGQGGGGGGTGGGGVLNSSADDAQKFPSDDVLYRFDSAANTTQHTNVLTQDYLNYVANISTALPNAVNAVSYTRPVDMNVLAKGADTVVKFDTSADSGGGGLSSMFGDSSLYWSEMPNSPDFILSVYDLIGQGSRLPTAKNEVALVVDDQNRLDEKFFEKLGIPQGDSSYTLEDFIGKTILTVVPNDEFYTVDANGLYTPASASQYDALYNSSEAVPLTITGILRIKPGASTDMGYLSEGIVYTTALTDYVEQTAQASAIAQAQAASTNDVLTGAPFVSDALRTQQLQSLGADSTPTGISIYPKDFAGKDEIKTYLDAYNTGKAAADQVIYSDISETIGTAISTMLNTVTFVLIGFAAISLIVSTIMIAIITYVSVLERTKEIGILRSLGARKK
ncbi:MAG: ABC transporter ATP-binding protein/permease, partial [Coriobacteriia bacterium]|nr:ABC transporter ATP-binding protein/permease [Coriobacteriia bacterium]